MNTDEDWVPGECTLPTTDRPLRVAEFDALFAVALRAQHRVSATVLHWEFDPAAGGTVRELVARESACCAFFTFTVSARSPALHVEVRVPEGRVDVLDALAARAAGASR